MNEIEVRESISEGTIVLKRISYCYKLFVIGNLLLSKIVHGLLLCIGGDGAYLLLNYC